MKDDRYEDLLDLPHPEPKHHPRMSRSQRAAQFSPFAALTGYDQIIKESSRTTDQDVELDEMEKEKIGRRLALLTEKSGIGAEIVYFEPDTKKSGGRFVSVSGRIRKLDADSGTVVLEDGTVLEIDQIRRIDRRDGET